MCFESVWKFEFTAELFSTSHCVHVGIAWTRIRITYCLTGRASPQSALKFLMEIPTTNSLFKNFIVEKEEKKNELNSCENSGVMLVVFCAYLRHCVRVYAWTSVYCKLHIQIRIYCILVNQRNYIASEMFRRIWNFWGLSRWVFCLKLIINIRTSLRFVLMFGPQARIQVYQFLMFPK